MVLLIKNPLWVYVCVLFLLSCSRYPQDVEDALLLSGNNKTELIQALEHYKNVITISLSLVIKSMAI